ncbi:MAG: cob(I)yrinic acid a,c-diamide adenosyltransferase [Armatimonadota bacterium]
MPKLDHGLLQVYTGDGKGKTTAAVGQAVRARGAGLRVCFIQFVKGGTPSSELEPLRALGVEVVRTATAPTGLLRRRPTEEDRAAARQSWEVAAEAVTSGAWDVIVLDELHAALRHDLLDVSAVVETIAARPSHVEVITTGRRAPEVLCAAADLVTEMRLEKHPFQAGMPARRGIEL